MPRWSRASAVRDRPGRHEILCARLSTRRTGRGGSPRWRAVRRNDAGRCKRAIWPARELTAVRNDGDAHPLQPAHGMPVDAPTVAMTCSTASWTDYGPNAGSTNGRLKRRRPLASIDRQGERALRPAGARADEARRGRYGQRRCRSNAPIRSSAPRSMRNRHSRASCSRLFNLAEDWEMREPQRANPARAHRAESREERPGPHPGAIAEFQPRSAGRAVRNAMSTTRHRRRRAPVPARHHRAGAIGEALALRWEDVNQGDGRSAVAARDQDGPATGMHHRGRCARHPRLNLPRINMQPAWCFANGRSPRPSRLQDAPQGVFRAASRCSGWGSRMRGCMIFAAPWRPAPPLRGLTHDWGYATLLRPQDHHHGRHAMPVALADSDGIREHRRRIDAAASMAAIMDGGRRRKDCPAEFRRG